MASIFTDLAKTFLEKVINGAISEASYICCFTCIVEDFEKEKVKLKAKMATMEQKVKMAKRRGEDIREDVTVWKQQADEVIEKDTKTKNTCFFGWCPNCKWRYIKGKDLANNVEEIRSLMEFNIENVGLASRLPGVEYHSSQNYISFKSRKVKYKELVDALKDANNYIIGLQGMGGTGKTTLAKEVGKELVGLKQFDYVIDTTVSYTPDIKKIQDDIAAPLGLKWEDCTESERPKKLWSRLTNGEKILVILDDVWGDISFEEIGIPCRDNHKGCSVLLTTRDLRVCKSMECDSTIQLDLLSDEDAWILFKKHANIISDKNYPNGLLDKGKKIVKECKGLPIAIASIASTLKVQKSQEEWKLALMSLRKISPMNGIEGNMIGVYKCLRYSYDNTKDEKVKQLFLLCSVFQEDEEINFETLTRLAVGVGIFGGKAVENYDEARSNVGVAKDKLIDSCLLIAEEDHVKMHDLVREVAMWISERTIQVVNLSNKNHKSLVLMEKNIKYLLCVGSPMDVFSYRFDGSNLEILIVVFDDTKCNCIQVPDSFYFENMKRLQVLYLSNKNWGLKTLSLLQSISSLSCIRSLILEGLELGDISILGALPSLETLDFLHCWIMELPCEITELKKLKLLKLYKGKITGKSNQFEVIARCLSLEELYLENVGMPPQLINGDQPIHLNTTFPALLRYRLIPRERFFYLSLSSLVTQYSRCVCVPHIEHLISKATIKYLMQRAQVLWIKEIKWNMENVMPEIIPMIEGRNDLADLYLESCPKLKHVIDTNHVDNFCSKLERLQLIKMPNLEELCNGPLPSNFLNSLEYLYINRCENLRGIFFNSKLNLCRLKTVRVWNCPMLELFLLSTSRTLVMLEKLGIVECMNLKSIIRDERIGEETGDEIVDVDYHDNKTFGTMFPNLKYLEISCCGQLQVIFPFLSAPDVPLLETIKITDCSEIKFIFGQQHDQQEVKDVLLPSLKHLYMLEVPNFINIFPEICHHKPSSMKGSSTEDGSEAQIPFEPIKNNISSWTQICCYGHRNDTQKLRSTARTNISLISKDDQKQECSIFSMSNSELLHLWERAQCLPEELQMLRNIKELTLSRLPKIKSIFILSLTPIMMLEVLNVSNCEELKHIVIDMKDDRSRDNRGDIFPRLKNLNVRDCGKLEYIFGEYPNDHNNHNDIPLQLPALEFMILWNLPNLIGICQETYRITLPALTYFNSYQFSQFKSICDMMVYLDSRQLDCTTTKDLSGNINHFLILEELQVIKSNLENIFCLNEINRQQINFRLRKLCLVDLPHMTSLFVGGHKGSFILQNLEVLKMEKCERLEVIFSVSISKCLPQLQHLSIIECNELKHIVEEDVENQEIMSDIVSPNEMKSCFPKLTKLNVKKCNKLKCLLHVSTFKDLPKLKFLLIEEASNLEQAFRCEHGDDQKVKLPNLQYVIFVHLPKMCQKIELQTLEGPLVQNCPNLSPTSKSTLDELEQILKEDREIGLSMMEEFFKAIDALRQESKTQGTHSKNLSDETTKEEFPVGFEVPTGEAEKEKELVAKIPHLELEIPSTEIFPTHSELISSPMDTIPPHITDSHESSNQQSMDEQCEMKQQEEPLRETNIALNNFPQKNDCLEETEEHIAQEGSTTSITITTTISSTESETGTTSLAPLQQVQGININVGAISEKDQVTTSSTDLESSLEKLITYDPLENGDEQKNMPSFSIATGEHQTTKVLRTQSHNLEGTKDHISQEGSESMTKLETISSSTSNSETTNTSLAPLQKGVKGSAGTILEKGQLITSSVSPLSKQSITSHHPPENDGDDHKTMSSFSVVSTEDHPTTKDAGGVKDSLKTCDFSAPLVETHSTDDDASEKRSLTIGIGVSESKPPSVAFESPSMNTYNLSSKGNLSQIEEENSLSLATPITKELEQLVSNKYLAQENLSLLTDFLVKHPTLQLVDNPPRRLTSKYRGYAYSCLAELLKFLQTHSALDVLESESMHSNFVELLEEVRNFPFDDDWLNDVERRVLSPNLPISQDAWKELLQSKKHATQEVKELRLKLQIFTQHVEDLKNQLASSEAVLESIIQQEALVLEARVSLSAPLGY